jgi:hypothetical protein
VAVSVVAEDDRGEPATEDTRVPAADGAVVPVADGETVAVTDAEPAAGTAAVSVVDEEVNPTARKMNIAATICRWMGEGHTREGGGGAVGERAAGGRPRKGGTLLRTASTPCIGRRRAGGSHKAPRQVTRERPTHEAYTHHGDESAHLRRWRGRYVRLRRAISAAAACSGVVKEGEQAVRRVRRRRHADNPVAPPHADTSPTPRPTPTPHASPK